MERSNSTFGSSDEANYSTGHASNTQHTMFGRGLAMMSSPLIPDRFNGPYPVTGTSGTIVKRRDISGFSITDAVYPEGLCLAKHYHNDAYLISVLSGEFVETYAGAKSICTQGNLRFLPPCELHENHYTSTSRCLLVRIDPSVLSRLREHASVLSSPGEVRGIACAWLAGRLQREFMAEDDIAGLAIEGVLLEILAESARSIGQADSGRAPRWLKRVREMLEENYLSSPSLTELAILAGVHQVHLSREFRKHYNCTIGEFIRKRRVEHACQLLSKSEAPLSEIALTCGFSDQSHFSAMFKAHIGLTPAKFREISS